MAAGTMASDQTTKSSPQKTMWKFLFGIAVLVLAFVAYRYSWNLGTTFLLAGTLLFILFILDPDWRKFGLFLFINIVIATIIGAIVQRELVRNENLFRFIQNNDFLAFFLTGYGDTVLWAVVIGLVVALLITGIPLLIVSYVSAMYVLALHEIEGISRWDALRYVLTLVLGINLPFIVVENGQALITKEASKLDLIGGPGKLVIKQGNVVVLERDGKISRVENAGVVKLKSKEKIRNIFALGPQSNSNEFKFVLTKDRIPLIIKLGISYQIEPANETDKRSESRIAPDGEALTEKLDDGLYQVYKGTIRKAARMSQAVTYAKRNIERCADQYCQDVEETTWQKAAGGLPEGEMRDYIMSHRFDELFELIDNADGEEPEVRVKKRKIYEIEQAILEQIKPSKIKALGVLIRSVDIGKIVFPSEARALLLDRWSEPWRQEIRKIASENNVETAKLEAQADVILARAQAQVLILEGQGEGEARAAFFREVLREMRREGVLEDEEMVAAVLRQLINTMVTFNDLEAFVRLAGLLEPLSRGQIEEGQRAH